MYDIYLTSTSIVFVKNTTTATCVVYMSPISCHFLFMILRKLITTCGVNVSVILVKKYFDSDAVSC